jgi:hypothetical protein
MWEKSFGMTDVIMGDVVFTGGTDEEGETLPLSNPWVLQLQDIAEKIRGAYEGGVKIYAGD